MSGRVAIGRCLQIICRQRHCHRPGLGADLDDLDRAALKAVSGAMWSDAVGPFYDTDGVMSLLGGVSKQAVNDRVRRHRLLALRTGSGRLVYPAAQFCDERVVDGLADVLDVLVPDNAEAWMVASWLATPDPELGDRAPFEALRAGAVDDVLRAARELASALRG